MMKIFRQFLLNYCGFNRLVDSINPLSDNHACINPFLANPDYSRFKFVLLFDHIKHYSRFKFVLLFDPI